MIHGRGHVLRAPTLHYAGIIKHRLLVPGAFRVEWNFRGVAQSGSAHGWGP